MTPAGDPVPALVAAVQAGDEPAARRLLAEHPALRTRLNEALPALPFGGTLLLAAVDSGSRELIDLLLESGADIDQRSRWWAGGFGVLDGDHDLHEFLVSRGAKVDACAAARMGRLDLLRDLAAADPACVRMRGGDGQTPLHVAASVETAAFLLDHGAEIDALDVDHESTPAQYAVAERPEVARYLVDRGCRTDILLVAALGDVARVRRHLEEDPASAHTQVSDACFPMRDPRAGDHIYRWTLGSNRTAHAVAHERGHDGVYDLLLSRTPAPLRLLVACQVGDAAGVGRLIEEQPGLPGSLTEPQRRALPDAARDGDAATLRLMVEAGWPLAVRGHEGGTALHWAAWHGDAETVDLLLRRGAPLELRDLSFGGTPLGWALHGSLNSWRRASGDHASVVRSLLAAGAVPPPGPHAGSESALRALRSRGA